MSGYSSEFELFVMFRMKCIRFTKLALNIPQVLDPSFTPPVQTLLEIMRKANCSGLNASTLYPHALHCQIFNSIIHFHGTCISTEFRASPMQTPLYGPYPWAREGQNFETFSQGSEHGKCRTAMYFRHVHSAAVGHRGAHCLQQISNSFYFISS